MSKQYIFNQNEVTYRDLGQIINKSSRTYVKTSAISRFHKTLRLYSFYSVCVINDECTIIYNYVLHSPLAGFI
jgi:hypothetical protein